MKDKEKAGTLKEIVPQISHSKKWPIKVRVERDGEMLSLNSYSLLQDRYYEHMAAAGFPDLERGEFGSTKVHLTTEEYKLEQERKHVAELEKQNKKLQAENKKLDAQISVKEKAKATLAEVEAMGRLAILGGSNFTDAETKRLKTLAKKSVNADKQIAESKKKMAVLEEQISDLNIKLHDAKIEVNHWHREYTTLWNEVKDFIGAIRKFPVRLREFIAELFRPEREAARVREQEQNQPTQKKKKTSRGYDR